MASAAPLSGEIAADGRPVLHLDGPVLKTALERLIASCEEQGGIENFAQAVKTKAALFAKLLGEGKAEALEEDDFIRLCAFMPTCRRRIGEPLRDLKYSHFRQSIVALLDGAADTASADARLAEFAAAFPGGKAWRWVRDLAAEILHHTLPERYPLMARWVWDAQANTGVLREIWHGNNVDHTLIEVGDGYQTFVMLREELSQFLADNGVFRDMLFYVDLLQAQVYADYVNAQGGSYLRTEFATEGDPLEHTRRLLGLDGVDPRTGRSRFKGADGSPLVVDEQKWLS